MTKLIYTYAYAYSWWQQLKIVQVQNPTACSRTEPLAQQAQLHVWARCPSCHSVNNVKELDESQNIDPNKRKSPTGVIPFLTHE